MSKVRKQTRIINKSWLKGEAIKFFAKHNRKLRTGVDRGVSTIGTANREERNVCLYFQGVK